MYKDIAHIPNETDTIISVWVEPWAFDIEIPAGKVATFIADSEIEGNFELDRTDNKIEIYGWCGSNLIVDIDGNEVWNTEELRVPGLPEGMSTRGFVDLVFNSGKKKRWWEFWK